MLHHLSEEILSTKIPDTFSEFSYVNRSCAIWIQWQPVFAYHLPRPLQQVPPWGTLHGLDQSSAARREEKSSHAGEIRTVRSAKLYTCYDSPSTKDRSILKKTLALRQFAWIFQNLLGKEEFLKKTPMGGRILSHRTVSFTWVPLWKVLMQQKGGFHLRTSGCYHPSPLQNAIKS